MLRKSLAAMAAALAIFVASLAPVSAASFVVPAWKAGIMQATTGFPLTGSVECVMVDTADDTLTTADDFLDDLLSAARVGTPQVLASKTYTTPSGGVFDAADITFPSVTGDSIEAIACYVNTAGADSTDPLVLWIDGISATPNGGNITIQWDSGVNRIFSL